MFADKAFGQFAPAIHSQSELSLKETLTEPPDRRTKSTACAFQEFA